MANFFCEICRKDTRFLTVQQAVQNLGVSKSAIYGWMRDGLVHWRTLPNHRRVICLESLSEQGGTKIVSRSVQNRADVSSKAT